MDYDSRLPSPRGVRVASFVRGQTMEVLASCRPREGCGLHLEAARQSYTNSADVAVPARGAGCISKRIQTRISTFVGSIQPAGSV